MRPLRTPSDHASHGGSCYAATAGQRYSPALQVRRPIRNLCLVHLSLVHTCCRADCDFPMSEPSGRDRGWSFTVSHEIQLDAVHPAKEWAKATPMTFCSDWQGRNADPQRQTTVRVLWSAQNLYLRFECRYRELYVFDDGDPNGRRDHLWERDVAEAFVQSDPLQPHYYKEFEVAPNGFWNDLDISPAPSRDLKSGLEHSTFLDKRQNRWLDELAIPLKSLTSDFNPRAVWRANFYRL